VRGEREGANYGVIYVLTLQDLDCISTASKSGGPIGPPVGFSCVAQRSLDTLCLSGAAGLVQGAQQLIVFEKGVQPLRGAKTSLGLDQGLASGISESGSEAPGCTRMST